MLAKTRVILKDRAMRIVLSILAVVLVTNAGAQSTTGTLERRVDEAVAAPLPDGRFSGVVLVTQHGRIRLRKAYGLADRERAIPNTPATRFMIMSVSKQFTAALILRLAAERRLNVEDRVSDYLADWPAEWDEVTIHHLLTHTAGTEIDTTYFWLVAHHPEYWPESGPPPRYEPRPLMTKPGSTFVYANVGYTLLSLVASAAAGGQPFDELLRDKVLCPLGMEDTEPERGERVSGRARGYRRTDAGFALSEQRTVDVVGAGDLVSTVDDLAKWDAALNDDRFLPRSLRAAMLTPYASGRLGDVGYGWFFRKSSDGQPLQFHSGSGAGFRAWNYRIPESGLTVIILSNVEDANATWVRVLVDAVAIEMKNADAR
jgi:CubicO group peptidase (beta-lactamase class C family)